MVYVQSAITVMDPMFHLYVAISFGIEADFSVSEAEESFFIGLFKFGDNEVPVEWTVRVAGGTATRETNRTVSLHGILCACASEPLPVPLSCAHLSLF